MDFYETWRVGKLTFWATSFPLEELWICKGNIDKNAIKVGVLEFACIFYGKNWLYENANIKRTAGWILMRYSALENWHSWLQFTNWHEQRILKGTLGKTRSKLMCLNLHAFSMGRTEFTKMRIFGERLDGFWWDMARWKTDILVYNSLIDTNKEFWREHWAKRDQS